MMTPLKPFAELLRAARERAGLTQRELAAQVGIDDSYISRVERRNSPPPIREKVVAILDALAISDKAERAVFLLAAGCAGNEELEGLALINKGSGSNQPRPPLLFASGTMRFPQASRSDQEALIQDVQELFQLVAASPEKRAEVITLLRSFINWLKQHASLESKK